MLNRLKELHPPSEYANSHKKRQAIRLLNITAMVIPALVVGQWIVRAWARPEDALVIWPGTVTILVTLAVWLLMRSGYIWLGSHLWVFIIWLLATATSAQNGGVSSAIFSLYVIPILLAGLLLSHRTSGFYVALSIIAGSVMLIGSEQGWLPNRPEGFAISGSLVRWLFNSVLFILAALILYQSTHSTNQALSQAQATARELTDAHARLEILRDMDRAILRAETPSTIAAAALARLYAMVPCKLMSVTVFGTSAGTIEALVVYVDGEYRSGLDTGQLYANSLGFEELRQGQVFIETDLISKPPTTPFRQQLQTQGIRSYISVPMLVQNSLIGSLNAGRDVQRIFETDEVRVVQEVANQLAIAIQQAQLLDQTQRHASELEQRIAARTADLTRANERLRELDQAKDTFVSNVSHELRTPISNLKLRHHLLKAHPESATQHLAVLIRETNRLESMIEGLLLLSRLDQDRVTFDLEIVDLSQIVAEYCEDRASLAESRHLTLTANVMPALPPVRADRRLIDQVLSILITNALAYTPAGGQVIVSTHCYPDGCVRAGFSVRDTGPGISYEEQARLFTRFSRGETGHKSGVEGTGLGLAIAKEIVSRHEGEITVESEGIPGKGTTFWVWLPAAKEPA